MPSPSHRIAGRIALFALTVALAATVASLRARRSDAAGPSSCNTASSAFTFQGSTGAYTLSAMAPNDSGVNWVSSSLSLKRSAATPTNGFLTPQVINASGADAVAAADFDGDGWTDLIGTSDRQAWLMFIRNASENSAAPDWDTQTALLAPDFRACIPGSPQASCTDYVNGPTPDLTKNNKKALVAGDFNGDGKQDFLVFSTHENTSYNDKPCIRRLYKGNGNGTFQAPVAAVQSDTDVGEIDWVSSSMQAVDVDGDSDLDVMLVNGNDPSPQVRALINNGSGSFLSSNLIATLSAVNGGWDATGAADDQFKYRGASAIAVGDFNGDANRRDIVVGSVGHPELLYLQHTGGLTYAAIQKWTPTVGVGVPAFGAITFVAPGDFDFDGRVDLIAGSTNWNYSPAVATCTRSLQTGCTDDGSAGNSSGQGADTWLLTNRNNWSGVPAVSTNFTLPAALTSHATGTHAHTTQYDWNTAVAIDYDDDTDCPSGAGCTSPTKADPDHTTDLIVADGDDSNKLYVFPNRRGALYQACSCTNNWSNWSAQVDTTNAQNRGIAFACLDPSTVNANGGSFSYQLSNEGGANAVNASWSPERSMWCADFPNIDNRLVWRVRMCPPADRHHTPSVTRVDVTYYYQARRLHTSAGISVSEGVKYIPGTNVPGNDGLLYAYKIDPSAPDTQMWEAGALLDARADSSRKIYTAYKHGTDCGGPPSGGSWNGTWDLIELTAANDNDHGLQYLLNQCALSGSAERTAIDSIITYVRGSRFGVTGSMHRLGGMTHGQVAVMTKPPAPYWRVSRPAVDCISDSANNEEKWIDDFRALYNARPTLVFATSRDGMVHAFYSNQADSTDVNNGREVWAFVPPAVAQYYANDQSDGVIDNYVDGSPLLADIYDNSQSGPTGTTNKYRSFLIMGTGYGGPNLPAYFALDVTDTATGTPPDLKMCGSVPCLSLKWQVTSADLPNMGQAISSPALVRAQACSGVSPAPLFRVAVASGPSSQANQTVGDTLYLLNIETGAVVWSRESDGNTCSFDAIPADPTALDFIGAAKDGITDRVAVGDLDGHVWEYDLSGTAIGTVNLGAGFANFALFDVATTTGGAKEPISASLSFDQAGATSELIFGTGGTESANSNTTFHVFGIDATTGAVLFQSGSGTFNALAAGNRVFGNVVVAADGNCFFAAGASDARSTAACLTSNSTLTEFNCASGAPVGSTLSINGTVKAPLFALGGVLTIATDAGLTTVGSGSGLSSGSGATGADCSAITCLSHRGSKEVW